ncbi:DDE-type integrase/transposase/recombinase [Nonomuraea deserti]|uniref:DDE-type integrase/transposase/recombinase n=1 Tax=Nonomuraea deserti TaxID=1848322 RepID=UPI0014046B62|nr:DDE-type integrase/transposase/recombinase [Nonomuraea deserti]
MQRRFDVEAPDRLWLTDISEHPTGEGKVYCAAVMDAYSRRVIGWSIDVRQDLVVNALAMAVARRKPDARSTILQSDHGTQYTSWAFGKRLRDARLLGSMGTVGDCYVNAMMVIVLGNDAARTPRCRNLENREELANAIFEWIRNHIKNEHFCRAYQVLGRAFHEAVWANLQVKHPGEYEYRRTAPKGGGNPDFLHRATGFNIELSTISSYFRHKLTRKGAYMRAGYVLLNKFPNNTVLQRISRGGGTSRK